MTADLIVLLNSAASADPSTVVSAGQQLLLLTANNSVDNPVYVNLAHVIFSNTDNVGSGLTPDGRFVGLIHLKNMLFDSRIWENLEMNERTIVRDLLLSYLSRGHNPSSKLNTVEQMPRVGSCVAELVARLVRNEWTKKNWSDSFWDQLLQWSAWTSLRLAIRAASSFRLPMRRRLFIQLIRHMLPSIVQLWKTSFSQGEENYEYSLRLSRLLHTCIASIGGSPINGPFLFNTDDAPLVGQVLETCFRNIKHDANQAGLDWPKLNRRLSKLILMTFLASSVTIRDHFVHEVLLQVVHTLTQVSSDQSIMLDKRSASWFLALLYGVLSSHISLNAARFTLGEVKLLEVHSWLFTPTTPGGTQNDLSTTPAFRLLSLLIHQWFPLSNSEIYGLIADPEACLSVGGSSGPAVILGTDAADEGGGGATINAAAIWDVDAQLREWTRLDLKSLLGLHGSERQLYAFEPCRQLIELLVNLFVRHYGDQGQMLLLQLFTDMQSKTTSPLGYEALMRLAQICFPFVGQHVPWTSAIDSLLSDGLQFVHSKLPISQISEGGETVVLATRILCLLTRRTFYYATDALSLADRCTPTMGHVVRFLLAGNPEGLSVGPLKATLCVRPCAAHALAWLLAQPLFPFEILETNVDVLVNGLAQLIQNSTECETRIYLLSVLCQLIESADLIGNPQLTGQLLHLLDQLWQLDSQSPALRANVLDAVTLMLTMLNSGQESDPDVIEFRTSMQEPIGVLISAALSADDGSGADALFEPGLRLWSTLLSGEGASWSPVIERLMHLMLGQEWTCQSTGDSVQLAASTRQPLLQRIDSSEQAMVYFGIIHKTLILACQNGRECGAQLVQTWTEPIWSTVLNSLAVRSADGAEGQSALDFLCSNAANLSAADGDDGPDCESKCRVKQLSVMLSWFSVYLDFTLTRTVPGQSIDQSALLTPSLAGLLVHAGRQCLLRAPVSSHEDVSPLATELRLGLLARLAIASPEHWLIFLQLLQTIFGTLTQDSGPGLGLSSSHQSSGTPIERILERWLARTDSLPSPLDRRCFALACLTALTHSALSLRDSSTLTDSSGLMEELHSHWLKPVINVCIQVLYDDQLTIPSYENNFNFPHPEILSARNGLVEKLQAALTRWQDAVGGASSASGLFDRHIGSVLKAQLETALSGTNSSTS